MNAITRRRAMASAASFAAAPAIIGAAENPRLKYVQIGTTHPHAGKISVYRESEDWDVAGVVEPDPERREAAKKSKTYEGLVFLSLEEALNLPGLSAVGIETDVRDLLDHAELAIDAGYHIHLDKPAGESFSHFERIYEKAEQKTLHIQMGYMYRFNPAVLFMMDCLKKGWLGEPFEVHAVMSKVVPAGGRREIGEYPGGIMFELGCHIIDLVVGVLGKPKKITAFPRRVVESEKDSLVDNMLAVFEYPRATATVKSSAVEVEGFARRHLVVCGTEGTCHIQPLDRPAVKLALSKDRDSLRKGYEEIPFEPPYRRYVGDAAALAAIIRGGESAVKAASLEDRDLAVQEAVLRSSGLPID